MLDKLDTFVENVLIPQYTKGVKKKGNPEYKKFMGRSDRLRRQGNTEKAKELRNQAQNLPSTVTDDPDYRRLNYVRYAEDFLLGFIGSKSEAEAIKQQLKTFLREELKLELSEEKTLITHARSEAARFLGYEITRMHNDEQRTKRRTNGGSETMRRSVNAQIGLRVPKDVIEAKCQRYSGQEKKAKHRAELLVNEDYTIVLTYQLEYRGIANYYQLAHNMFHLGRLYDNQTELVQRLLADFCELCGSDKGVEVHHVRAMRKFHEYPGRSKPAWVKRMIALRRKTLVLCKSAMKRQNMDYRSHGR